MTDTTDFDAVINFRDFGGGPGADGRTVKRGHLFRSGHYAAASEADLERMAALDFALLVDLRRPPERARDPARRPAACRADIIEHLGPADVALPPHLAFLADPDATPERVRAQMTEGYRYYPFDPYYVAVYREYFPRLATVDGPVLINCHAGKDRTGFLCALTLHVLGSPEEAIVEDYLATNRHSRAEARLPELSQQFEATHGRPVSDTLLRAMLAADEAWLKAAFAAIAAEHDDTDRYLEQVVGVTPALREAIRDRLLA